MVGSSEAEEGLVDQDMLVVYMPMSTQKPKSTIDFRVRS